MTKRAVITGVGHYLPKKIVLNSEFEKTLNTSDDWIITRSGIRQRHFSNGDETTSKMAVLAGKQAMEDANIAVSDLDAIILATSTADLTFPSAATMVQAGLGMRHGFAYDVQAVCAGFIYALSIANAQIVSGQANRILVIGSETFSNLMDWSDRSTCVLFGDGAGAVVLEGHNANGTKEDRGILSVDLNSDGSFRDILYVDGGVSKKTTGYLKMEGKEVFKHAVEKLAKTSEKAMAKACIKSSEVDWVVPHQANVRIIQGTARKMGIPDEKVIKTVQDHGNTSAASIPLALSVASKSGQIEENDLIVTEAIGGGLAWGAIVLRW